MRVLGDVIPCSGVVRAGRRAGEQAGGQGNALRRVPDVGVRRGVELVTLIEIAAGSSNVGSAYHGILHDLLLQGHVPLMGAAGRQVGIEIHQRIHRTRGDGIRRGHVDNVPAVDSCDHSRRREQGIVLQRLVSGRVEAVRVQIALRRIAAHACFVAEAGNRKIVKAIAATQNRRPRAFAQTPGDARARSEVALVGIHHVVRKARLLGCLRLHADGEKLVVHRSLGIALLDHLILRKRQDHSIVSLVEPHNVVARLRDGWTIFVAQSVTQRQTIAQLEFILRVQRVFLVAPQIVRAGEGVVVGLEKPHVHFGRLGTGQIHGLVGRPGSRVVQGCVVGPE